MAEPVRRSDAPRPNQIDVVGHFQTVQDTKTGIHNDTKLNNTRSDLRREWSFVYSPKRSGRMAFDEKIAFARSEEENEQPVSARQMPSEVDIKAAIFNMSIEASAVKRVRSNSAQEFIIKEKPGKEKKQDKKDSLLLPPRKSLRETQSLPASIEESSSNSSKMFEDNSPRVKKLNTMQKLPTRSKSMLNRSITFSKKERFTITQKANIEAILTIAFQGKGKRFHEEEQLARHIQVMEDVKKNIEIEEGIFIFRNQGTCNFQIPCDETEYTIKYKASEHLKNIEASKNEKRLNQVYSEPTEEKQEEETKQVQEVNWEHTQKIVVYDDRSLYLFHHQTKFRRIIVGLTEDKKFENFTLILIISNSFCLLWYDYKDRGNECAYNRYLEQGMRIFTWFFISEAVLKIISQGFIKHRNSYLRDPWNILDLTVVITALIEMIFGGQNFKGMRTLRVFRPLRSINQFPTMKRLIRSLGASAGPLMQAVFFLTVVFILFSILGVKQFYGSFYQRCRTTSDKVLNAQGVWIWPYDKAIDRLCSKNEWGYICPDGMICGTPLDVGLSMHSDHPEEQKLINYGVTTFDNLLCGFITIFQMITKEGWVVLMYDLIDSGQPFFARIFCASIIFTCAFFLLNVILAVLAESIDEASKEDPYEIKRRDEISKSLLRARTQKRKMFKKTDSLQSFLEQEELSQKTVEKKSIINVTQTDQRHDDNQSELFVSRVGETKQKGETRNINNFQKNKNSKLSKYNSIQPSSQNFFRSSKNSKESEQSRKKDTSFQIKTPVDSSLEQLSSQQLNQDKSLSPIPSVQNITTVHTPGNTTPVQNAETLQTVQSQVPATEVKFNTTIMTQNADEEKEVDSPKAHVKHVKMLLIQESILYEKRKSEKLPKHVTESEFFQLCYAIARSPLFNFVFILITIVNTVSLASYYKGISQQETDRLDAMERIFRWLFLSEMIMKLLGLGFKQYIRDGFNVLEALLVVLSILEEAIALSVLSQDLHAGAFTSFRALRLLRIFRLARSWKTLHALVNMMEKSIKDVSTFSVLLLIMMTIFLLLGRELFSNRITFENKELTKPTQTPKGTKEVFVPRWNFDEPDIGFITIFLVIVGDDWNRIMYDFYRALYNHDNSKAYFSIFYFIFLYVVGNIVLLNLFLAILLANFDMNKDEQDDYLDDSEIENQANSCVMFWVWLRIKVAKCFPKYITAPAIAEREQTTSSSSFTDEEESKSENAGEENKDSNSKSQQSGEDPFTDMFQTDQNTKKPEKNQLEMQLLKIRAENLQKSQLKSAMISGSQRPHTRATIPLKPTAHTSLEVSPNFVSGSLDMRLKQSENEGGSSEGNAQSQREPIAFQVQESKRNSLPESSLSKQHQESEESKGDHSSSRLQSAKSSGNKQLPKKPLAARQERLDERAAKRKASIKKNRRSTVVLALIQQHKIKAMQRRSQAAARLQKLKNAERTSIASIKLQEHISNKSVYMHRDDSEIITGTSLHFFNDESKFRNYLNKIVQSNWFANAVIVSIMISTLILILENPSYNPNSTFILTLELLNNLMTLVFILEAVIKIIVYGFIFNGENSYLRNIWNVMDFIIVMTSFLGFFEFAGDTQFIKIMRMLRVLKPLSMVGRNQGMRTVIQSLGHAIPEIANLLLVTIMILILFSILGTIIFQGLFYYCHTDNIQLKNAQLKTKWECFDYGGEWVNKDANFDDVFRGLLTMFEIITTEGWIDIMWSGVDANSFDVVPEINKNLPASTFFIGAMIIGGLFLLNLFVGVVINNFNIEKEKLQRNYMLTPLQIEYCDTLAICYGMKPIAEYVTQGNTFKDYLYYVTISPVFENTISLSIVLNTMVMACSWYDEPVAMSTAMERVNVAFSVVFTVEAFIKITVQESAYFKDGWSLFDFIIVLISWVDFAFGLYIGQEKTGSAISLFRAFRVARLLRMIKRFQQLRKIFYTFVKSLRQLYNVASLLLLLLVLYSVLGVSFFHSVMLNGSLDEHANFQSFSLAMFTLFRMTTGEAWNELMHDAGRQRSILFQCEKNHQDRGHIQHIQQREDVWIEHAPMGCGNQVAKAYFVSFMLIVSIIFLNMFIAIILEGFSASQQEEMARIKEDAFDTFVNCWQNYDSEATGFIVIDDLELLITDLIQAELKKRTGTNHRQDIMFNLHRDPKLLLFVKMQNNLDAENDKLMEDLSRDTHLRRAVIRYMNNFVSSLHIPTYQNMSFYQFHDTLATFIKYVFTMQHKDQFKSRSERIERQKQTGVYLYKWDKMQEKSLAFYKMSITDQEIFLELSRPEFDEVVDRLEGKSQTKDERIQRVELMRQLRKTTARQYAQQLDYWGDNVMDSSLVIGGRRMIKFAQEWRERRRKQLLLDAISEEKSDEKSEEKSEFLDIQVQSLESSQRQKPLGYTQYVLEEPYLNFSEIADKTGNLPIVVMNSADMRQQTTFKKLTQATEEEEKKLSSVQSLVISDLDYDSKKQCTQKNKYQQISSMHECDNQIVVEQTIIEKKLFIIPNAKIQLKLSPQQTHGQFYNHTLQRNMTQTPSRNNEQFKKNNLLEENYSDDGSGGARVETPRRIDRRRALVLRTDSLQIVESAGGDGDGSGSKGRYSQKEMQIMTLENL